VVSPDLCAAHTGEEVFDVVGIDAVARAVEVDVVHLHHVEADVQLIPGVGFVRHYAGRGIHSVDDEAPPRAL
jgi:hypothetical protein